ncbi:hypothetical protein F4692_003513 [Nocardioides cavernae]|uniref:Serine protease n=1 Tax=Nocardioides cavernae TaxID=1921566 RepID=A0A7Y9KTB5_9ACTN|nr:serine protease [Nocardioides cavernae]NYE38365.1 hypothetical protein [Nocardioides cavernae]
MPRPGARTPLLALALAMVGVVVGVVAAAVLPALPAQASSEGRYAGTAALPGCSGAVIRWPGALDTDRAVVLTNGHCVRVPFLDAREVLVGERRRTRIDLLDGDGRVATTVRAVRLQYATMFRTDVAVLSLRETYADLAADGVIPLVLATQGPARGDRVRIPSGYWTEQRTCRTRGTAYRLHEQVWDWSRSIRLPARDGCRIRGGYSGSPIVDRGTGLVVGVANTGYAGGRECVDSACEEDRRGHVVTRRQMNYGQQTALLLGCLAEGRTLDLDVPGCRLPKPRD